MYSLLHFNTRGLYNAIYLTEGPIRWDGPVTKVVFLRRHYLVFSIWSYVYALWLIHAMIVLFVVVCICFVFVFFVDVCICFVLFFLSLHCTLWLKRISSKFRTYFSLSTCISDILETPSASLSFLQERLKYPLFSLNLLIDL